MPCMCVCVCDVRVTNLVLHAQWCNTVARIAVDSGIEHHDDQQAQSTKSNIKSQGNPL